jgi:hypothetical protein
MCELKVTLRPLYRNRIWTTVTILHVDITACPQVRPGCNSWRDSPTCEIIFTILLLFILGATAYFRGLASPFPGFPDIWVFRAWGRPSPNPEDQDKSVWAAPRSKPVRHGWPHHQLGTAGTALLYKRLQVMKEITEYCLVLNGHNSILRDSHDGTLHLGLLTFRLFII